MGTVVKMAHGALMGAVGQASAIGYALPSSPPLLSWTNVHTLTTPRCCSFARHLPYPNISNHPFMSWLTAVYANPYSWNNISNLLYLEAPAGVGFSYADTPAGLVFNDTVNAQDNLNALVAFFKSYPEFSGNDFYLSGESYAGVYVPTTAYAVVQYNLGSANKINIKGILVGNGCLGTEVGVCGGDGIGQWYNLQELRGHGLVSYPTYQQTLAACGDWSNLGPNCVNWLNQVSDEVGHINVYYIYGPCHTNFSMPELAPTATVADLDAAKLLIESGQVLTKPLAHNFRRPPSKLERKINMHKGLGGPDGCIDAGDVTWYLNLPSVISALHVAQNLPWVICSGNISYTPTEQDERAIIYPTLIEKAKLRVLIYNGESDACGKCGIDAYSHSTCATRMLYLLFNAVPYTDNEAWTASMNYTVVSPWTAWMVNQDWVGGYITQYAHNFTFLTVRGAGHMVPEYQPAAAWYFFNQYLTGGFA